MYEDDDVIFAVEKFPKAAFLHFGVKRWSKAVAKKTIEKLLDVEEQMKAEGFQHILCYNPEQSEQWVKLVTTLTDYEPMFTIPENGHVVYGRAL